MKTLLNSNEILKQKIEKMSDANKELNEKIAEQDGIMNELQTTEEKALGNNAELERELIEVKMTIRKKDIMIEELSKQCREATAKVFNL